MSPFDHLQSLSQSVSDAVRWACILEATAPKAGNVHPGASFDDLTFADFQNAADAITQPMSAVGVPVGQRVLDSVTRTHERCQSNVNLGIVLLLGPLAVATEQCLGESGWPVRRSALRKNTAAITLAIDLKQSQQIFTAIHSANPGGMGKVESMDVRSVPDAPVSIRQAMEAAKSRDRVALQYADGFSDLFDEVVPILETSIRNSDDMNSGICAAQIRLLGDTPDSLIARKCGFEIAQRVQTWAKATDPESASERQELDRRLRSEGHRLNPGTTADLIAAGLFVMMASQRTR